MAACYKSSYTTMTYIPFLYRQEKHHQHCRSFTSSIHSPSCAAITDPNTMVIHLILSFLVVSSLAPEAHAIPHSNISCRSYCGNLTIDYPFALRFGCGHPGFRDLLFCINDYLMLHLPSGSYRVLDIDYSFHSLTLHEPHLSDCLTLSLGRRANGFSLETWRTPYLSPVPDNAFLLLGCSARSPLFQGFPTRRLPCRNVSGISCEEYYQCPGWSTIGASSAAAGTRWGPPECCALSFQAIKEINLSKLECEGYSSAYSLAPLKVGGPHEWSYGIRVKYSVQGARSFVGHVRPLAAHAGSAEATSEFRSCACVKVLTPPQIVIRV